MLDLTRRRGLAGLSGRTAATLVVLVLAACGGSGGGGPAAPGAPPAAPPASSAFTVTLTASGATPKELRVPLGSRVTFVNQDSRSHQMMSAPHPMHTDCPAINEVGMIDRGETKVTGTFATARDCGFHDNLRDGDASLRGVILVGDSERDPNYGY